MKRIGILIGMLWIFCMAGAVAAQDDAVDFRAPPEGPSEELYPRRSGEPEFVFIRGKYTNYPADGMQEYSNVWRHREWWQTDFDDADRNLMRGIQRYTLIDTDAHAYKPMSLTDPALFEHPFLYINMKRVPLFSGNGPNFSPKEASALAEYMRRGGVVMLDDFWGPEHWADFLVELHKIFPNRKPERLKIDHAVFHCFFDINEIKQVPGRGVTWNFGWGFTLDNPDYPTAVYAVFDDNRRLMMLINFNTDLGDGLEHTFDQFYPTRYCNYAYKLTINYIIYALSH